MTALSADTRRQAFARLSRRNNVVRVLRIAVPAGGCLLLVGLVVQIVLANIGSRYGISQVAVSPDSISLATPEYSGMMADGSTYRVWAASAAAPLTRTDVLDLDQAGILVSRTDGTTLQAEAAYAQLDTANDIVTVPGLADFSYSSGTKGQLTDSIIEMETQTLTSRGAVTVDYADGTTVRAQGLVYDSEAVRWTFTNAVVTLASTPGEKLP
ncbi:MAG: hypothetical protein KIT02_13270 [Devosia sp.]|uniref:hypothetical protein n=1 Tax=Devosia sp. TaxID=1871048 RepID=UPI0024CCC9BF|nr:hypothetical protein [Devosia sp.]UYN98894.1 MAG: hypothetical protein KIT02_13270 [Devosia sp.]